MLSNEQIQAYYLTYPLRLPKHWTLGRKHLRIMLRDGRFVKLNHFENHPTEMDPTKYGGRSETEQQRHDNGMFCLPEKRNTILLERVPEEYLDRPRMK